MNRKTISLNVSLAKKYRRQAITCDMIKEVTGLPDVGRSINSLPFVTRTFNRIRSTANAHNIYPPYFVFVLCNYFLYKQLVIANNRIAVTLGLTVILIAHNIIINDSNFIHKL